MATIVSEAPKQFLSAVFYSAEDLATPQLLTPPAGARYAMLQFQENNGRWSPSGTLDNGGFIALVNESVFLCTDPLSDVAIAADAPAATCFVGYWR